ncbi:MAG TPA: hypothetical protein VFQ41_10750 [Candidatus Angelobacter sp.]|nr:hypothetical protein [Candidatus Angelobacter sp.]
MNKAEIVKAIQKCARKLRRNPTLREVEAAGVTRGILYDRWGGLGNAMAAAGLTTTGAGFLRPDSTVLLDWAAVARKLGKVPSAQEYVRTGQYHHLTFMGRFKHWSKVPQAFARFARESRMEQDWKDVLELVARHAAAQANPVRKGRFSRSIKSTVLPGQPIYGPPLALPELAHEPVNEAGVIFAFGVLAGRLRFCVHRMQTEFPDCEAVREVARGQWQKVRVEFEFESRNFLKHKHDPNGCDVIVCWFHNWPECPPNIVVVELSKIMKEMQ